MAPVMTKELKGIEQSYVLDCAPRMPSAKRQADAQARMPYLNLSRLRGAIRQALTDTKNHKGHAAGLLGVHPNTLTRLLSQMAERAQLRSSYNR